MSRYDRRDPTPAEMRLTRASHHIWRLIRAMRRKQSGTEAERIEFDALEGALETIWEAKRQVKREIKAKSEESFKKWRGK
jgi:hypothetical protein